MDDDPDCNVEQDQFISDKVAKYFELLEKDLGKPLTRTQKNFWVAQYRELGDKIYQEYPSTDVEAFMATKDGAYYARLYMEFVKKLGHERTDLYDKNLDVQLAVDLGMDDTNVLGVFQEYVNEEIRVIDGFEDNGQRIKYYTDWIRKQHWFRNLTHVILPHDAEVNELTSGKTRTQVFEDELRYWESNLAEGERGTPTNILFTVLPKVDRITGIDMVREMLHNFWIDPNKCAYLVDCIYNYTKEWDEKRDRFRDIPLHNEYSNGADCIRYIAMGRSKFIPKSRLPTKRGNGDYDV